jgi:hypothetical protein
MKQSEHINELSLAMSKAQSQIKGAIKDSKNPFFKSNYADLQSVWEAVRQPLTNNDLCVIQTSGFHNETPVIVTTLSHKSGQWIQGYFPLVTSKPNDPQALGSATSYARRYALAAICGVYQTDDDAHLASEDVPHPAVNTNKNTHEKASEAQQKFLYAIAKSRGLTNGEMEGILLQHGFKSFKEIPWSMVNDIKDEFESWNR